jgi:ferritin-like metal-binding protein YciE
MKLETLNDLFIDELRDLYDAEKRLVRALPKMAKACHSTQLRQGFEEHLEQTKDHVQRLEQIFEKLGTRSSGKKCYGMRGLIDEGEEMIGERAEPGVMDAGIIGAAQKVEHYEIAGYGTVCTWAQQLGQHDALRLLKQTLQEEKTTDEKLTRLAEAGINQGALAGAHR